MTFSRTLAIVAAVAGLALGTLPATAETAPMVIHIATTPTDIGAEPFYAQDQGFFKKAGLDGQTQVISNGGAIAAAVASGAIDIAQSNIVTLATAHEKGLDLVIIAPAGVYSSKSPTSALVVSMTSPYKTAKDLNGKIIANNGMKNISQIGPMAWIDKNGGDAASNKWIEIPFPEMPAALEQNRVDAALIAEPELSNALTKGTRVLGWAYDGIAPSFTIGAWFTTAAWAKAHPDAVKRFQSAMRETAIWANKHKTASAAILNKYTKIVVAPGMHRTTYGEKLDTASMQPLVDAAAKYGAIKASFPAGDMIAAEAR